MKCDSRSRVCFILEGEICRSSTKKNIVRPRSSGTGAAAPPAALPRAAASCASSLWLPAFTRSKNKISRGLRSIFRRNCSRLRSPTNVPPLSKTVTSVCTRAVLTRITSSLWPGEACGCWANAPAANVESVAKRKSVRIGKPRIRMVERFRTRTRVAGKIVGDDIMAVGKIGLPKLRLRYKRR